MKLVDVNQVSKQFGTKLVLSQVNLTIERGEFVALVGMSGSGKSTLLRMIAGLDQPTSGTVTQGNTQITGINQQARVMFQDDRLLPWMTVKDNLSFGTHSAEIDAQVKELLARTELADQADKYPNALSGGQKQRAALARALMAKPELLLLDEPLGALDALTRRKMQTLIQAIVAERQITTILVTHDINEAVRMANRVVVVKNQGIAADLPNPYRDTDTPTGKLKRSELVDQVLAVINGEAAVAG